MYRSDDAWTWQRVNGKREKWERGEREGNEGRTFARPVAVNGQEIVEFLEIFHLVISLEINSEPSIPA